MIQEIFSPDGTLKAIISPRADGSFQVEFHQFFREHSPDIGDNSSWKKIPGLSLAPSLADAIELASRHVGAGTEDFFDEQDD